MLQIFHLDKVSRWIYLTQCLANMQHFAGHNLLMYENNVRSIKLSRKLLK